MLEKEKPILVEKIFAMYLFISVPFFLCIYILHAHPHMYTNIHTLMIAKFVTFPLEFSLESNPTYLFDYMQILSHCNDAVGEPFVC